MDREQRIDIADCGNRSVCPLTNTLDVIGDRWTLLIIRDMLFVGKKQFGDFLESPEGISTNILTDRLKKLEAYGMVKKRPYQTHPVRYAYSLTEAGYALKPIVTAIADWGITHIKGVQGPTEAMLEEMREKYR